MSNTITQLSVVVTFSILSACLGEAVIAQSTSPSATEPTSTADYNADRNAYFGDLHVHTKYSFDAFLFGTIASPDEAYEFAKGKPLRHPGGFNMQMHQPLDFYAVTDHAATLGVLDSVAEAGSPLAASELGLAVRALDDLPSRLIAFRTFGGLMRQLRGEYPIQQEIVRNAWLDTVAAANRHNDPGKFTTFIAYEYTTSRNGNLHRNVIFEGDTAPPMPFSTINSRNPEDLWDWMDNLRETGIESLAIPHNSNGSNGQMFSLLDYGGSPLDMAYADSRMRNEPLVENVQIKGQSDAHPALSPNDEWADFEILPYIIASRNLSEPSGSYVREALKRGVEFSANEGFNPFKFGIVGGSDTHLAASPGYEDDFWGNQVFGKTNL